jgi:type I restriction enzyme R subunit
MPEARAVLRTAAKQGRAMTPGDYSENALVEQPAIALFRELGWDTANCFYEQFGPGGTLGRETKGEVVRTARLRPALERLNPTLDPEALRLAVEELTRDRSVMSPPRPTARSTGCSRTASR